MLNHDVVYTGFEKLTTLLAPETPWLLVRKRTIPTERPLLVGEVSANVCG
jgi:hypothetical protein